LINVPQDIALVTGTASEDANWLVVINQDGTVAVLNKLRSQDINGWTNWSTDGDYVRASVVDDDLFFAVRRTIDGVELNYLEVWDFEARTDCETRYASALSRPAPQLDGKTISVWSEDGTVLPQREVSGGVWTMTQEEVDNYPTVFAGLPFTPRMVPMPINTGFAGSPNNAARRKRIVRMNVRVLNTFGLYIDGQPVPIRRFGDSSDSPLGTAPELQTGIVDDVLNTIGWNRDTMPEFTVPDPTPCHLQMIEYEVESS
jgi:hypothetical protein